MSPRIVSDVPPRATHKMAFQTLLDRVAQTQRVLQQCGLDLNNHPIDTLLYLVNDGWGPADIAEMFGGPSQRAVKES